MTLEYRLGNIDRRGGNQHVNKLWEQASGKIKEDKENQHKTIKLLKIPHPFLMAESEEQLKSLLMKVKEESENAGLKFNNQKTKIMASSPITSWQIDGETMATVTDYFLGLQNHMDGDCSHEIKRCLLLGRKDMTNLDSILKRETSLC